MMGFFTISGFHKSMHEWYVLKLVDSMTPRIKELIFSAAANILKKEIREDEDLVIRTIKDAARNLTNRDRIYLSVHYSEARHVLESKSKILSAQSMIKDLEIIATDDVSPGGCIINSATGIIDAGLDSQMEALDEILNNE